MVGALVVVEVVFSTDTRKVLADDLFCQLLPLPVVVVVVVVANFLNLEVN